MLLNSLIQQTLIKGPGFSHVEPTGVLPPPQEWPPRQLLPLSPRGPHPASSEAQPCFEALHLQHLMKASETSEEGKEKVKPVISC